MLEHLREIFLRSSNLKLNPKKMFFLEEENKVFRSCCRKKDLSNYKWRKDFLSKIGQFFILEASLKFSRLLLLFLQEIVKDFSLMAEPLGAFSRHNCCTTVEWVSVERTPLSHWYSTCL